MENMQPDKSNLLVPEDQPYHSSHLSSEHTARVFLHYSSPSAEMVAPGKGILVTRTFPQALAQVELPLPVLVLIT